MKSILKKIRKASCVILFLSFSIVSLASLPSPTLFTIKTSSKGFFKDTSYSANKIAFSADNQRSRRLKNFLFGTTVQSTDSTKRNWWTRLEYKLNHIQLFKPKDTSQLTVETKKTMANHYATYSLCSAVVGCINPLFLIPSIIYADKANDYEPYLSKKSKTNLAIAKGIRKVALLILIGLLLIIGNLVFEGLLKAIFHIHRYLKRLQPPA